jgi:PAS domain S-box-containing protein
MNDEGNPYDYKFLEINPAFEKLTGLRAADLIGKTQLEVMPNSEPLWAERYGNVATTGKPIAFENYSAELKKHYQVSAYAPEPGKFATVFLDITDRKKAEEELHLREQALANSERFLKTVIDSEPDCIKLLDIDNNLLMINRAGLEMIEADTFDQVKGQCISPFITDAYRDAFTALTKQVFQGIPGTLEFELIGLKGRHVWLETHAVAFRDEQGEIISLLGITRDITERKTAEIAREEALARVKKLEGIIPICMHCKKIRDDLNSWNQLEQYISSHSEAMFSHGICPQCYEEQMKTLQKDLKSL